MQRGPLMQGKRAPAFQLACAVMLALWIIGCFALLLSALHAHTMRGPRCTPTKREAW